MTDKNTPFQAVKNKGWKFVTSSNDYAYRMYGFPTKAQFQQFVGNHESLLIPIHYDMCVSVELVDAFLDAEDQMILPTQEVADCFHDPIENVPTEFILFRPRIKTVQEFLSFHK